MPICSNSVFICRLLFAIFVLTWWIIMCFLFVQPGYHLKFVGPNFFSCQKLGQIYVHIHSNEVTEEPFPSALLSLSGDDGYRNNSITGVGGYFTFENLFPGSFYLRPLLKVYAENTALLPF